jgi:hypothetical protein
LAHQDFIAIGKAIRAANQLSVYPRAMLASQVMKPETVHFLNDPRMAAGNGRVFDDKLALGMTSDDRLATR